MAEIVYILTNESMPGYVKIGRTQNIERRLKELYSTPVPLPFECHYACEVENSKDTEDWLFRIFKKWRVSNDREFFKIEPEGAVEALKIKAIREVTPKKQYVESESDRKALEKAKERRSRFNFDLVQIPVGAELYFSRDKNIKSRVIDTHSVYSIEFNGEKSSLSFSAQNILGYKYGVAGTDYWMYEDETLDERRRRFENGE